MKKFVISPDVLNILGADPGRAQISVNQPQPQPKTQPQPKQKSFWKRACSFFKKVGRVLIKPVLALVNACSGALNAVSNFMHVKLIRDKWVGAR